MQGCACVELPAGLNSLLYQLPYGPGLWDSIRRWPNSALGRINVITKFLSFDCGADWFVYVETLLPAAGELFLVLIDFDWDDIARGFFRPAGIRARRKMRNRKRKKKRFKFELPEIGELIGKNIPGAKFVKGRRVGTLGRWFWRIDGIAQRFLWYWLVVDMTIDFFYNWSTGIMTHKRCVMSGDAWMIGGPGFLSIIPNGGWRRSGLPLPYEYGGQFLVTGLPYRVPAGCVADVLYLWDDYKPFLPAGVSVSTRIVTDRRGVIDTSPVVDMRDIDDYVPLSLGTAYAGETVWAEVNATASRPTSIFAHKCWGYIRVRRQQVGGDFA